jgi:hypothetical protein
MPDLLNSRMYEGVWRERLPAIVTRLNLTRTDGVSDTAEGDVKEKTGSTAVVEACSRRSVYRNQS